MKKAKKRNWYEEQKERREREQREKEMLEYLREHPEDMPELMVQEGYAKNEEEARAIVDKLNAGDVVVRGRIIGNEGHGRVLFPV